MIDEAKIDTDERGFLLVLTGDFGELVERYLDKDAATLTLRLPQDAAIELLAQVETAIAPWAAEMNYERDAHRRAGHHERAGVLHGVPDEEPGGKLLELGDYLRKRDREAR